VNSPILSLVSPGKTIKRKGGLAYCAGDAQKREKVMRILDLSAGLREMWFDKVAPQTIFLDIREEVHPNIVADAQRLPFKDCSFDLVVFDPPHAPIGPNSVWTKKYGRFTTTQIIELVINGSKEAARVLKVDGILIFKWNTHNISLSRILRLVSHGLTPLFGQRSAFRTKSSSSTYWITYRKIKE